MVGKVVSWWVEHMMRLTCTIGVVLKEQLRIGWYVVNWDALQLAPPVIFYRLKNTTERLASHIRPHIISYATFAAGSDWLAAQSDHIP